MFDSVSNVNDYLSEHWLAEVFPNKLKDLAKAWKELDSQGKNTPVKGLSAISGNYLTALGKLPDPAQTDYVASVTDLHRMLLSAVGFNSTETVLETFQGETPIAVPLLGRVASATATDALHILQAVPAIDADALFSADAELISPLQLSITGAKTELLGSVSKAVTQLFVSDHAPRYLLVVAGSVVLLTDAARWSEGRYLAFDVATALDRRDEKATGELAHHAGLWSADVLLPNDDGKTALDAFTEDSEKHAVGVSEDLREGLRISIERIANEVLDQRRAAGRPVNGIPELPKDLTIQSLRFLYRILFLLFAEARPELGILPVGAPEYGSGYGLDRLRQVIEVPLVAESANRYHLHESLNLLFRLVNDGRREGEVDGDGLVFEPMRSDLFDPKRTPLIDSIKIRNSVLQEVLKLLMKSKPSNVKGKQAGYISYSQLGINQLGAVYEGLMSYSGLIALEDMVELAKDGNPGRGSWLIPSEKSGDYAPEDIVWREDRLTGRKDIVRHAKGSFVFRQSGRDRQRSASYYTPEMLTKSVVKNSLSELIDDKTTAAQILNYTICEPALGSGAFLNEAINQLAAEYLARRQDEIGERIDPEEYSIELQKVKSYLALHRAYGVDLNATAVELAEVSLWLNVMHRGLQAPWFGLHLRRGNSLIGARRATYDFTSLGRGRKSWLQTSPTDRPLGQGPIGEGEIHHFLLPAVGWGGVAISAQGKELSPDDCFALEQWRNAIHRKPTVKQIARLQSLARRVERLWELALKRLEISEREVSRQIEIWGVQLPVVETAVTREQVESELSDPEGPFMRLHLAMDAWCALWFWPTDKSGDAPDLDQWIWTLEGLLGADGAGRGSSGQAMFHESVESFDALAKLDEMERAFFGMLPTWKLLERHPWIGVARQIAGEQGFFHWDLDFGQVFARGGFDLVVGNPPWVRPTWQEGQTLAEWDPYLILEDNIPEEIFSARREALLNDEVVRESYLAELVLSSGASSYFNSKVNYNQLSGTQTDLYMLFIVVGWRVVKSSGIVGLLHQDGHFSAPTAGSFRRLVYRRLRLHAQFSNKYKIFPEVSTSRIFSLNVYGSDSEIEFRNISDLYRVDTLENSILHSGDGEAPNLQSADGKWNVMPHKSRIATVVLRDLKAWVKLFDEPKTNPLETRIVKSFTKEHLDILRVFGENSVRMSDLEVRFSTGWHEKASKKNGTIKWETRQPNSVNELILQGNHFDPGIAYSNEPRWGCRNRYDWDGVDLSAIDLHFLPRVNYSTDLSIDNFVDKYDHWMPLDSRAVENALDYWRVAWRKMVDSTTERTFRPAIIAPGVTHIDALCAVASSGRAKGALEPVSEKEVMRATVLIAGLFSSLPYDYLVKVSGKANVNGDLVSRFPAPIDHFASDLVAHRALRLNCITSDYSDLWEKLFDESFESDTWTSAYSWFSDLRSTEPSWNGATPLRSDFERRAALVELDVLSALMLGLSPELLSLMCRAQFPILMKYESEMYFDRSGRRISQSHHAYGSRQSKSDYATLERYLEFGDPGDLLDRYDPFPPDANHDEPWFYKPDREAEMRTAYAEFERRLGLNG